MTKAEVKRKRATNAEKAVRYCKLMHLRIAEGKSAREIALDLDVTTRTVQRDLAALRHGRPSAASRLALNQYCHFYDEYLEALILAVRLGTKALKTYGVDSPMRAACDQLTGEIPISLRNFRQSVAGEDAPRATSAELRPNAHLDVVKRFDRTREFYEAPSMLVEDVRGALIEFGPRNLKPRRMGHVERELRMALACYATEMKREEIATAFGCSAKTVTRTKARALALEPRIEEWGGEIKDALCALERDYTYLNLGCLASGAGIQDLVLRKLLLDRITEAHILLGTLNNGPLDRYEGRRGELLDAVRKAGDEHGIPPEGIDHMVLLATAWADHKSLPGGRPPLPPKPRPRKSAGAEGCDTNT